MKNLILPVCLTFHVVTAVPKAGFVQSMVHIAFHLEYFAPSDYEA